MTSPDIARMIATGDRADLKKWLIECSNAALLEHWVRLSCCKVQDFQELTSAEMIKREIIREAKLPVTVPPALARSPS